ncbi:MAG TPA: ATP-grasp domain-containing protein [Streptosporangiaceae bacterium]|jgi:predicted ATP-grasp superfamily ATP-dependent carboligase
MAVADTSSAATSSARPVPVQRTATARASGQDGYDILVLDASTRQSLACARSLGRAGLRVALGECYAECDPALPVLAFRSRYSARNVVLPSFGTDPAQYGAAVAEFVQQHPTPVVLPASDGAMAALRPWRDRLAAAGCLLALPPADALDIATDKYRTLEVARGLGIDRPETMRIDSLDDVPSMLAKFDFPFVLKPTTSWPSSSAQRLKTVEVVDEAEAYARSRTFLSAGAGVLAQQWVGGRREGVTLFVVDSDVRASFAHLEHRTSPALGGASVLRESMPMPPDIHSASARLAAALGLQGLCEVEFRRDADGRPLLMEINARLAGQIETALLSGVDFPLLIWQWASGQPVDRIDSYHSGYRMRWLRGDMRWLRDNHRQIGRPDSVPQARALWTFLTEFARTTHYDCLDWRDLGPVMAEMRTTASAVRHSRAGR